ncbi:electron transfer flavoprotein subunit beta/FixA family protein [Candidatus Avelusimicrobium faecicola]|uniref:electron transfer flavoprotein subunit beta/FixA family protein n=1 Tax=Candidatus Avelusimicrobium faecicola TaxID=3416205 RepID=UPI0015A441B1|nr:electron transfer flavoprotein subunit beta/FixA family protein [Spirochaetota bacterium]MCI7535600.1 electron transfer flavoprotein subunit beta/FixA family protein [Spirochaetota bacterium]MDY2939677.1 electron transfer flavoprotein subunit beta/FixA family protein [Elusimicrobiaceae bacterium]
MNIIVCIKQVPDSTRVKVDPKTGTLIRAGVPSILNPYDHYALEKALAIKAKTGAKVTVLSMGPAQAVAVLRLALALGADEGVLLSSRAFAGSDTWATSYALAMAIRKIGSFDMILCGQMAIDGDTAQTGPGIAFHLGIPQITFCESVDSDGSHAVVKKLIEGGHQILEADLPVLITMTMPVDYAPKYPSFMAAHKAQDKKTVTWTEKEIGADMHKLGLEGSPTRVSRIFPPAARQKGEMFNGSAEEMAAKFVEILKKESFIK